MLGIMRYSTAIIQYNPSEQLEKKTEEDKRNQGQEQRKYYTPPSIVRQDDATIYLKGGLKRARE